MPFFVGCAYEVKPETLPHDAWHDSLERVYVTCTGSRLTTTAIRADDISELGCLDYLLIVDDLRYLGDSVTVRPILLDREKSRAKLDDTAIGFDLLPDDSLMLPLADRQEATFREGRSRLQLFRYLDGLDDAMWVVGVVYLEERGASSSLLHLVRDT